jgi:hypothetical protein
MILNLENKFGGKPEFTPTFVNNLVRTVLASGNTLRTDEIGRFLNEPDNKKLLDKVEFGHKNGFWQIGEDSTISIHTVKEFSEESWTPFRFSNYLMDSICSRQLENPENWNSFAALFSWGYSLKTSSMEVSGRRTFQAPNRWSDFEKFGISTGLSIRDKDGSGLVINDVQWNVAKKWMLAIGSFVQFHGFKIPSSFLLSQRLKSIIQEMHDELTPVRDIVNMIRSDIPFLPGGVYGKMWRSFLETQWQEIDFSIHVEKDQENTLTQQESLALLTLEASGLIILRDVNDAGDRFVITAGLSGDLRPVSHIEVMAKKEVKNG